MTGRPCAAAPTRAVRNGHEIFHWVAVSHLALMVAVLAGLAGAGPAAAHAKLVATDPAREATVTSLAAVRLRFSEVLRPEFSTVAVTAPDGAQVVSGSPAVAGTEITVPVAAAAPGSYTIAYRVLSADGHPVEGSYVVTYALPTAPAVPPSAASAVPSLTPSPPPTPSAEPTDVVATGSAATGTVDGGGASQFAVGAGLVCCAALLAAGLGWRRRRSDHA